MASLPFKFLLALLLLCSVTLVLLTPQISSSKASLVLESGLLVSPATGLIDFELVSHAQQSFTRENLKGQWHIVAYGYTHCPDICPTILMLLSQLKQKLITEGRYDDVNFLFYSIDPMRDSSEQLAQYMAYFDESFVGIRQREGKRLHLGFEQSLAIKALISTDSSDQVQVRHGMALYLINPDAKLQAVLTPKLDPFGKNEFSFDAIFADYISIRTFISDAQTR
jgi:protein SCO1/2